MGIVTRPATTIERLKTMAVLRKSAIVNSAAFLMRVPILWAIGLRFRVTYLDGVDFWGRC